MREYQNELDLKIKAGVPIIQIISPDWRRIHGCVIKAARNNEKELYLWNNANGIKKWRFDTQEWIDEKPDIREPLEALQWFIDKDRSMTILLMEDLFAYFDAMQSREIIGFLRTFQRSNRGNNLLLSQPFRSLPSILEKDVYVLEIPLPDREILQTTLRSVVNEIKMDYERAPEEDFPMIAEAALGLTDLEAKFTFKEIALSKKKLTKYEITLIVERKEQIIKKSGILEYFHPKENFNDVGGLEILKEWLKTRKAGFEPDAKDFGLTPPKGVLLLGVQGCGKSLVAKSIASEWNIPLLRFDIGKVFGGIVGESEANIRKALSIAEAISPSILWIDEIEKGLSGIESSSASDAGTTARVFSTMLTWMQEKEKPVFVVATANNIEKLPPELLRKGRFDEIFFVDLPGPESRREIWKIHLNRRMGKSRFQAANIDIPELVRISKYYSGAEIEEAVNEGLYTAYNNDRELTTEDLVNAINKTYPLSKIMADKIDNLRKWARVRARLASKEEPEEVSRSDEKVPKLKQEMDNPFVSN